jgi:hypothetical protein
LQKESLRLVLSFPQVREASKGLKRPVKTKSPVDTKYKMPEEARLAWRDGSALDLLVLAAEQILS